jgi:outer membrane protein assembly factor BamA
MKAINAFAMNKNNILVFLIIAVMLQGNVLAQQSPSTEQKDEKAKQFVAAPLIFSSPAFGNGLGAMGLYFYKPESAGEKSPPSTVTMVGAYSDTDSYFVGVFNQNHLRNDHLRPKAGYANGRINNNFDIPTLGDVKFATNVNAIFGGLDWRHKGDLFFGVTAGYIDSSYQAKNNAAKAYFKLFDVKDNTSGQIGFSVSYDSRDNTRYPEKGALSSLKFTLIPELLGSEQGYSALEIQTNHYLEQKHGHILALRAYGRFTPEDTPYVGLSTLGQRSDLRGYTAGEKVAENLISTQAEYRWMFKPKWGVVGFAGVATLYDTGIGNIENDNIYYSSGVGLRYVLHEENRVNFRVDFAWGENDDSGYYVSMVEAF